MSCCAIRRLPFMKGKGSMKIKTLDVRLIDLLEEKYGSLWWPADMYPEGTSVDLFKHLIVTVLSQSTNDANCIRAYNRLAAKFEIKPEALACADEAETKEAIRCGGLYNIKAKNIKEISRTVLERYEGDMEPLLLLPKKEARSRLMELPGVGNKTADVLLADRHSYREVIPIDTHMYRVAKRLGLAKQDAEYDETQQALLDFIPRARRERASGLLWLLAKHTCIARKPRCQECLLASLCEHIVTK